MSGTVRWGILAPGKIAHKFATGLQELPDASLQAVGSRDLQKANEFGEKYAIPSRYGSYSELVEDPEVDIIYIATPHAFHMENTLLCLEHKKAVLCEKPLAINSQQVKRMIRASKDQECFLMEALWSRFLPHIQKARELTLAGAIGEVKGLKADFGFQANYDPDSRLFNAHLGGGALLDIGIYPLFLARLILGQPLDVTAKVKLAPTGVDLETSVKLDYDNNKYADLEFSFAENTAVEAHIIGDRGKIILQNRWYQPGNLLLQQANGQQEVKIAQTGNGYNYQAAEAMRCLHQGLIESPEWSHNDSWELMQLMDEIRRQGGVTYPMD